MLTLNRKSDYALIALTHLGRFRGTITSAREIADAYKIPLPLLMNILKQLTREGMIASVRGARGGYRLAVEPENLTVKQVLLAVGLQLPSYRRNIDHDDSPLLCWTAAITNPATGACRLGNPAACVNNGFERVMPMRVRRSAGPEDLGCDLPAARPRIRRSNSKQSGPDQGQSGKPSDFLRMGVDVCGRAGR